MCWCTRRRRRTPAGGKKELCESRKPPKKRKGNRKNHTGFSRTRPNAGRSKRPISCNDRTTSRLVRWIGYVDKSGFQGFGLQNKKLGRRGHRFGQFRTLSGGNSSSERMAKRSQKLGISLQISNVLAGFAATAGLRPETRPLGLTQVQAAGDHPSERGTSLAHSDCRAADSQRS